MKEHAQPSFDGPSLFAAFRENRDKRPDSAAFLIAAGDRFVPISWRQFVADVETAAHLVRTRAPGATIGLLGENSYEWIVAHVACVFGGACVVPLEVTLTPEEIAERLSFTGATVLVHSSLYSERARAAGARAPGVFVAGFGSADTDRAVERARAEFARSGEPGVFDRPPRAGTETAMIVFTSGTTSRPRGAELTIDGLGAFVAFASSQLPMKAGDRSLLLLPAHHIFGLSVAYLMLANGVAMGVCPDFRRICDAVERFRANFCFLVPALADILAAKIEQRGVSAVAALGTPIDWVLVGGAPLARSAAERLERLGIRALTAYGLTETTALYSIAPAAAHRVGSAGMACRRFGTETRVSDRGELLIRGPSVLKGYFREPERTAEVLSADGWFRTGDLGRIDADGYVFITGRASRTIVLSSGKKVAPEELEELVLGLPGVREVVVSGEGASREIRAEIFADGVPEAEIRARVDALNRLLPVHKRIRAVTVRSEPFPRTASCKIRLPPSAAPKRRRPGRKRGLAFALAVTAAVVLAVNALSHFFVAHGVNMPPSVRSVYAIVEDFGEVFLALFALFAYFVSAKVFDGRRGGEDGGK